MKMTRFKKTLSLVLCIVLIAAIALFTAGCNDNKDTGSNTTTTPTEQTTEASKATTIGEGEKSFSFTVTDIDGNSTEFLVLTDEATVGEALLEAKLIEGEEGQYGLYVKKVNGITADYDVDGTYWAFYIDGEYAMTGVDMTDIVEGASYSFKQEK